MDIKGKKVLIVGLAKSGAAAAKALSAMGAEVSGYDRKKFTGIDPEAAALLAGSAGRLLLGGTEPLEDEDWDLLVLSPGVPLDLPFIANAAARGAEVIGELELAWRLSRASFAAVTGTNGKTTTTTLLGEIFKLAGRKTAVAGNIGYPAVSAALEDGMDEAAWMVTEVSSFQLETTKEFHPRVALLLNITPDHLDRHGSLESYAAAKARIHANQNEGDVFVANMDDPSAWAAREGCRARVMGFSRLREPEQGAFVRGGRITVRGADGLTADICGVSELQIPGAHNLENALAAAAAAFAAGVGPEVIGEALRAFRGVAHRLEPAGEIGGVRFVNDSKGTNVDAAIKAIEATEPMIILIAGGYDKHVSFDAFIDAFSGKVKALMLMGATAGQIKAAAEAKGFGDLALCGGMRECVEKAYALAEPGDTVLLSPACASWDMYSCFEERGEDFKDCVRGLGGS